MAWIVAIIVGGLIGWLASLIMRTDPQQGLLANILIGIVGAVLGRWLFADVLNIGSAAAAGAFTFWGLVWGIVGAILLIIILKAVGVLR